MQTVETSPLVAARQRRTWEAIHQAASSQTVEVGLDCVTVARIAEQAGVSPRTFFNYFDSKEDAIVGLRHPQVTPQALDSLRDSAGDLPLLRVARLVTDVAASTIGPGVDMPRRRRLAREHPSLRTRLAQIFTESRKHVIDELIVSIDEPWHGIDGLPTDPMEAQALVLLASAVVTFAWTADPDRILNHRDDALTDAVATFRKVTRASL